jgi:glycosyltransferase involved in cell wall biosynthesis
MIEDSLEQWLTTTVTGTPDLSVVIPAYNERERIGPTIASIAAHMSRTGMSWELIIADDGSIDGTPDILTGLGFANLRVVGGGGNEGKGAAVRRGLLAARGDAVLFTDADMSTPIDEVDGMLTELRGGADLVIASRAAEGADVAEKSLMRRVVSGGLRWLVAALLPTGVADTQCGFKLFRREIAQELAELQTIDGFSFDLELLHIARRRRMSVVEVPVQWIDAPGSKVDPAVEALRFIRDIGRIRWRGLRGAYRPRPTLGGGLHIAVVSPYPPSGTTLNEYGAHLVDALAAKPEIDRLTLFHDRCPSAPVVPAGVVPVEAWRFGSLRNPIRLLAAARRHRPDAVLFNIQFASFGAGRVSAALGLFAPVLMRWSGIPTVVLLHNLVDTVDLDTAGITSNRLLASAYRTIGRTLTRVLLRADLVAVTIPAYAELLEQRYGATNVVLTPHGTFPAPEVEALGPEAAPTVMAFGKFGTYKRIEPLVEAIRIVRDRGHESVELVIAGTDTGTCVGYLDSVRDANLDMDGLHFTGYVAEEDVPRVFGASTMVAFPYTGTTGSSGPLHQAGAYGRAAVLPAIGDFLDVIAEEGFTGETFEPGDAASLADAIERLLVDDERRDHIARQNADAAGALPIDHVADWHVLHLERLARA